MLGFSDDKYLIRTKKRLVTATKMPRHESVKHYTDS